MRKEEDYYGDLKTKFVLYIPTGGVRQGKNSGKEALVAFKKEHIATPKPLVALAHGFQCNRKYYRDLAEALCSKCDCVVFVPDLTPLMAFRRSSLTHLRERCVRQFAEQIQWLLKRNEQQGDVLHGQLDGEKVLVAGHSAGGAVAFESAGRFLRDTVSGILALDAVPWLRTLECAHDSQVREWLASPKVNLCSLRAPESGFNMNGLVLELLHRAGNDDNSQETAEFADVLIHETLHGDFSPNLASWRISRMFLYIFRIQSFNQKLIERCTDYAVEYVTCWRKGDLEPFFEFSKQQQELGNARLFRGVYTREQIGKEKSIPYFLK